MNAGLLKMAWRGHSGGIRQAVHAEEPG